MRIYCKPHWTRDGVKKPATQTRDSSGLYGEALCDDCRDARAEASEQAFLDRYFGSSVPVTFNEHLFAAHRAKAESR